jgi:transcriptional regulator
MSAQGCVLTEQQVQKIVSLLASTDMTMTQIAARMGCSKAVVSAVNRKFRVRPKSSSKR